MNRIRQGIVGLLLTGLGMGLIGTPIALIACDLAASKNVCCCPPSSAKSGCCPMEEKSECPVLKSAPTTPQAVIPAKIKLSYVVVSSPLKQTAAVLIVESNCEITRNDLSPPSDTASPTHSLRAPPFLA